MPYMSIDKCQVWYKNTLAAIQKINELTDSELTGKDFYSLEFRGKNHRLVLTRDGHTIAKGIYQIQETIRHLYLYYKFVERKYHGKK